MYKCEECGSIFEDAIYAREFVGEAWGTPQYENSKACPECKSVEIERLRKCKCGEWIAAEKDYCDICIAERDAVFSESIAYITKNLGYGYEDAKDLMATIYE